MKFIYQTLIFIFFVLSIYSQEYTIIVKSNKESTQKKDVINITKDEQIHYNLDKLKKKLVF
jgi:hypothetical protein